MSENLNLSERLGRYSITARGQIGGGRSVGEIAGYAAAVGAGLVMAGAADASVVYSGIRNVSIAIDPTKTTTADTFTNDAPSLGIDINGDGDDDVFLRNSFYAQRIGNPTASYYGIGAAVFAALGVQFVGSSNVPGALAGSVLPHGAVIGPGDVFKAGSAGLAHGQELGGGGPVPPFDAGNFAMSVTGIAGLLLADGDYGWIRLHIKNTGRNNPFTPNLLSGEGYPDEITAIDWAYATDGEAIAAGVPVPTPLSLLAAGAVGIGAFRRRKVSVRLH